MPATPKILPARACKKKQQIVFSGKMVLCGNNRYFQVLLLPMIGNDSTQE
jgi:hypothetical protein